MIRLLKKLIPLVVLFVGTSAFAQFRIATVDLNRVFTNYWKTREAQTVIDGKLEDIQKTDKEMVATFTKAKDDYQRMMDSVNDPAVSAEEKDKRQRAAEDKLKDVKDQQDNIVQFERGSSTTLEEQRHRMRDNIIGEIRTTITALAKTDGYTMVIDSDATTINQTPVLLYSSPGTNDITDAIIKQINIGAPVDIPKSDEKPAAKDDKK
jgi:outer membrane protein